MRVTQQSLINNFLRNLNETNTRLLRVNKEISSGRRVERPEDDPIAAAAITRVSSQISESEQFSENILQSLSNLNTMDSTLGDLSAIFIRGRELAVQAANATLSETERDAIAVEVNQLLESMVQIGNSTIGNSAIFAGHETLSRPFEVVRGSDAGEVRDVVTRDGKIRQDLNANNITRIIYKGDAQKQSIEVDRKLEVNSNITGHDVFFYDDLINSTGPKLEAKTVGLTINTLLENIMNAENTQGVSSGYLDIRNTRAPHLREDTNPDPALDNSTKLLQINNRRGIGRDKAGNILSLGDVRFTDSAGTSVIFNTNVATLTADTASIQNAVDFLNSQMYDPTANPAGPKLRFMIAEDQIQMIDNANGTQGTKAEDENGDGVISGVAGTNLSTFVQDLGLTPILQQRTLDANQTQLGLFNEFGGVRLASVRETMTGRIEFNDGTFLELQSGNSDGQRFVFDDNTGLAGGRTDVNFPYLPGTTSIQDILDRLDTRMGFAANTHTFANINAANSFVGVTYPDSSNEQFTFATLAGVGTTLVGNPVTAITGGANNLNEIETQLRNRMTRQDLNGSFDMYLSNGAVFNFNLGQTNLNQISTLQNVIDELNAQAGILPGSPTFAVSPNGQAIDLIPPAGTTLDTVIDQDGSTVAFDLGLLKPFLSVNAGFPNLSGANEDFPAINFDLRTTLSEWTGKNNITSSINGGQIRIQDSTGKEQVINLTTINEDSTVEDFIALFNSSGSEVKAELSSNDYGLFFRDLAGGSGNFFVEDFFGSTLVETLGIGTPLRGAKDLYDGTAAAHLDLTAIGDTILTMDDLLKQINSQTEGIGVQAMIDEATSQLVFEDNRVPSERGKYRVGVESAVGLKTELESLNSGGGINNFKIRLTDSRGVSTIIDFQEAKTVEDVIHAINLSNEAITEKTPLKQIEGLNIPLGTIQMSSSFGTTQVNLSGLTPASTVLQLTDALKQGAAQIQMDVDLRLDLEDRSLSFNFIDILGGRENGNISIQDVTGNSTAEVKLNAIAEGSPFRSGRLVHKKANVSASLNQDRSGFELVDNFGGELRVTEVEGRTTAHDLGLIFQGPGIGTSNNGVLRGRALNAFEKLGDELGLSKKHSIKDVAYPDGISLVEGYSGINDEYQASRSPVLTTRKLQTLKGSVDMDHRLHQRSRLSLLGNATGNSDYKGNPIDNIDLSGILKIESLSDDGTGSYQRVIVDLKDLPDNANYKDLDRLIQQEITADDRFEAHVQTRITHDGRIKFISEIPIRIGKDDSYDAVTTPGATAQQNADATAARGASSSLNIFGVELTDFGHEISSSLLNLKRPLTQGVDLENFFIDDFNGSGSLEVDLNDIIYETEANRREIEIGDLKTYVQEKAQRPVELTSSTLLVDLEVDFPLNIPFNAANAVEVDTVTPFNALTSTSTLGDLVTAFNAPLPLSVFNGVAQIAIADGNNSPKSDTAKKLVILDQTGLATGGTLQINRIPRELNLFFNDLGLKMGGTVTTTGTTGIGILGEQITGLGYEPDFDLDDKGTLRLGGKTSLDSRGRPIPGSGRIGIREGDGSTASDLKLLPGTGAIGNDTRIIHSGDLNPGVDRSTLLSEISPKGNGFNTNFQEALKKLYVENGKDSAFIDLSDPPVTLETPFKAFNNGKYDSVGGFYKGGVDVGRPGSGFVIQDQFGNSAIVDLSNNRSVFTSTTVQNLTAGNTVPPSANSRFTGAAGDFTGVQVGDYIEIDSDGSGLESRKRKFQVLAIDTAAGAFIDVGADPTSLDLATANNYDVNIFQGKESLHASMEKEYRNKPFYSQNSVLKDLQAAIDIALDKAKRTTGFGIDKMEIVEHPETGGFQLLVTGEDGPTLTITERDTNGDGASDSSTAKDLGLLRDSGARGNGSPQITSGPLKVAPSMSYILDKINNDLSDVSITASIGNSGTGPTLDITSNTDSTYIKIRDSFEGNTASHLGMSATRSLFQTLIDFRDSLFRNDPSNISDLVLEKIGVDEEHILQFRAQVGSVVNRFETSTDRLASSKIELTKRLSDSQDLNIADAIIELRQLETSQRASLSMGSRVIQQTLLDFLR
jgi:flagellar hook-associated protein 3 FlgL